MALWNLPQVLMAAFSRPASGRNHCRVCNLLVVENNWKSLFAMTELFGQLAKIVAKKLKFQYNIDEEKNVKYYLRQVYEEKK
jgi:hypothetical protein